MSLSLPRNLSVLLWGLIPKNPAFLRGIRNPTSSHPSPPRPPHPIPPHPNKTLKPQKSSFHKSKSGVDVRGSSKSKEGRKRAGAVYFALHFSAHPARSPGQLPSLPAGPESRSCYGGAGRGLRGRGVGAGRGRGEPPPLLPQAAAGVGRRSWRRSLGRGRRGAASPPRPRLRNAPPAATPADRPTRVRSRNLSALRGSARPQRLRQSPPARGGSAPAAGPVRCRGGRGRPGSQGLLTGTTVSRGRNHGVSPSPRRGGRSSSPLSGSTSGRRAGPAPIPVHQPSRDAWGDRGSPAAPPHWPDGPAAPPPHEERGRPGDGRPGSHDNGCLGPGFSRSSGLPGAQVDRHAAAFLPRRGGLLILGGGENAPRPPPHLQLQKQKLRALGRARQRGKTPSRPSSVSPHGPPPVPCLASSLVSLFSPGGFGL